MEFMNDNIPIHTATIIKNCYDESDIPLVDLPPYSSDQNPIENCWAKFEERIYMPYPDLELFQGTKKQLKECFYKGIEEVEEFRGSSFRSLNKTYCSFRGQRVMCTLLM